jgi:predicted nuclease of predicted toxin-antitoxin system
VTRLFITLYADEDVDVLVADLMRARGFDMLTTREAQRLHATDEEQLAFAASEGRAILTHNRADFRIAASNLYRYGETPCGNPRRRASSAL